MPLTAKGDKILHGMEETYGSKEKAEQVLYPSKNAGKITGIDSAKDDFAAKLDAACAGAATLDRRADMVMADDHRVIGGVGGPEPDPKTVRTGAYTDASFPTSLSHGGESYHETGKRGKDRSSGEESAEYEAVDKDGHKTGRRVWRTGSGKITRD